MNDSKRNTPKPNNGTPTPNKPLHPTSQAECYAEAWTLCLNKLSKEQQAELLINLRKPIMELRGLELWPKDVKRFVKGVAETGEGIFEALVKAGHKMKA